MLASLLFLYFYLLLPFSRFSSLAFSVFYFLPRSLSTSRPFGAPLVFSSFLYFPLDLSLCSIACPLFTSPVVPSFLLLSLTAFSPFLALSCHHLYPFFKTCSYSPLVLPLFLSFWPSSLYFHILCPVSPSFGPGIPLISNCFFTSSSFFLSLLLLVTAFSLSLLFPPFLSSFLIFAFLYLSSLLPPCFLHVFTSHPPCSAFFHFTFASIVSFLALFRSTIFLVPAFMLFLFFFLYLLYLDSSFSLFSSFMFLRACSSLLFPFSFLFLCGSVYCLTPSFLFLFQLSHIPLIFSSNLFPLSLFYYIIVYCSAYLSHFLFSLLFILFVLLAFY